MRNDNGKACPVCKAGVEVDKVIPIYGRGSDPDRGVRGVQPVPPRPCGLRPAVVVSTLVGSCVCGGGVALILPS